MAELACYRHGEELLRVALGERTLIGRSPECDLVLPDPEVSRRQAVVVRAGQNYHLEDLSGHGTRVGDKEVTEAPLVEGAEIALGDWRILFRAETTPVTVTTRSSGDTNVRMERDPDPRRPMHVRVRRRGRDWTEPLEGENFYIGKDPSNNLTIDDPYVSARHARLELRGGRWWVIDLGSTNGTKVGGAAITQCELLPGVVVAIGDVALTLEEGDVPAGSVPEGTAWHGMLSRDPAMVEVFRQIETVSSAKMGVIVFGETGTGKELVARALHDASGRRGQFVAVNCGAIAFSLIESELFGHEKGAFTGATRMRKGAFEHANGGTLLLDEIGELPLEQQVKLLRVLEANRVTRVGGAEPIPVTARVVAATHRDLRAQVRAGKFREDLYYRLAVVPIYLPPLRARSRDVRALAEAFLKESLPPGRVATWSDDAVRKLEGYRWPGNIRQLRNVVQRALFTGGSGRIIGPDAVVFDEAVDVPSRWSDNDTLFLRGLTLEDAEREILRLALRRNGGKRVAVSRELGVTKNTLLRRIAEWGLQDEGREADEPEDEPEEPDDGSEAGDPA